MVLGRLVGSEAPARYAALAAALRPRTAPVPAGSGLTGLYHPEYDGYPSLKGAKVKQADTVMLSFPLGVPMDAAVLANDLRWYDRNTDPDGPAMTWAVFALGWMVAGNHSRAAELFRRGFEPNVKPPFNVWQETVHGGCTPFLTGAGGFLQSVLFGATGMRLNPDNLTFSTVPPPSLFGATAISLERLAYRGLRIDQRVTGDHITFSLADPAPTGRSPRLIDTSGKEHPMGTEGVTFSRDSAPFTLLP